MQRSAPSHWTANMAHCVAISGSSFESQGVDINLNVWCIMDAFLALQNTTEGTNIQSNTHTHTHTDLQLGKYTHTHTQLQKEVMK